MKTLLQWFLAGIFVFLALFVFLPSYYVLTTNSSSLPVAPTPPAPPSPDKIDDASVKAYTQKVTAYQAAVTAHTAHLNSIAASDHLARYKLVVNETLVSYFGATLASLITFAFASGAIQVWNNYNLMKNGRDPKDITLFP